ncbi:MAG: hypothetical protein AABW49_03070 [Nanoarchaeota archaeon]
MRDHSHADQIKRWADYVRTHPQEDWIKHLKPLIDSQIIMANRFYKELAITTEGKEKVKKLRNIKNDNAIQGL